MGNVPQRDTKRDQALIKDYLLKENGKWVYTVSELGMKYARIENDKIIPLTATRIHQILDHYNIPKSRKSNY